MSLHTSTLRKTTGILMSAERNHRKTCRALPNSRNFANTNRIVPAKLLVWINRDLASLAPTQAGRQHEAEFAAFGLGIAGCDSSLAHQAQLVFRHRSLQPEQQPIVDDSRIIGAIRIDNHCAGKCAQIDKVMPVPPIARQA